MDSKRTFVPTSSAAPAIVAWAHSGRADPPDEIDLCPRSWAARAYPNLIHYNKLAKGGHFAAFELPQHRSSEFPRANMYHAGGLGTCLWMPSL
jgi:hypothetical protein